MCGGAGRLGDVFPTNVKPRGTTCQQVFSGLIGADILGNIEHEGGRIETWGKHSGRVRFLELTIGRASWEALCLLYLRGPW